VKNNKATNGVNIVNFLKRNLQSSSYAVRCAHGIITLL
jgi:hypothetical protein